MLEAAALLTFLALSPPETTYRLSEEEMLEIDIESIVVVSPIPFLNVFYVDEEAWEQRHELRREQRKQRREQRKQRRAQRKQRRVDKRTRGRSG